MVFSNFDTTYQDIVQLWLNYRYVSKMFKEEAEHIFTNKFVPKTSLFISNSRWSIHIDHCLVLIGHHHSGSSTWSQHSNGKA